MAHADKVTRKELLKTEDKFFIFSSKFFAFIKNNSKQLQYAGIVLLILAVVYSGWSVVSKISDNKGNNAYYSAFMAFEKAIVESSADPDNEISLIKEAADLFKSVTDNQGMSSVAEVAFAPRAYLAYREGKYDEAIKLYQEFSKSLKKNDPMMSFVSLGIASCYEASGNIDQAKHILDPLATGKNSPAKEIALVSLARLCRLSGDNDKAKTLLLSFQEEFPYSPFLPLVKSWS